MPRNFGIERVTRQRVFALYKPETTPRDDQVQICGLSTDRAIALFDLQLPRCIDLESDCTAMTASAMRYFLTQGLVRHPAKNFHNSLVFYSPSRARPCVESATQCPRALPETKNPPRLTQFF